METSTTLPTRHYEHHEHHERKRRQCGCAPCEQECCGLDCLVAPNFFCGQLLTDVDMNVLVEWIRDKFRLARFLGWGVVCGMDVRCDHAAPGRVVVGPGYARGCCGDDIVICEDAWIDLSGACGEDVDPCGDLRPPRREPISAIGDYADAGSRLAEWELTAGRGRVYGDIRGDNGNGDGNEDGNGAGGARAVDLYVAYREEGAEPQPALARGNCTQSGECEFSRTREGYRLFWEPLEGPGDPLTADAKAWERGFRRCSQVLTEFQRVFPSVGDGDGEAVRTWLVRWIDEHPPHQFCYLRRQICTVSDDYLEDEANLVRILFPLVQDCRNAYASCGCYGCETAQGVRLARVWVRAETQGRGSRCEVLAIDSYEPYRRTLRPVCWPAPGGKWNVAQVLWHRWPDACTELAGLGVRTGAAVTWEPPDTLAELEDELDFSPFVGCEDEATPYVYDSGALGIRVVRFGPRVVLGERSVRVEKTSSPETASPGDAVAYKVVVTNVGRDEVTVSVEDSQFGELTDGVTLQRGQAESYDRTITAARPAGRKTNAVTVRDVETGAVLGTGRHTMTVVEAQENADLGLTLEKRVGQRSSTTVVYEVVVHNPNAVALVDVTLEDKLWSSPPEPFRLEPNARTDFRYRALLPAEFERFTNEVHAKAGAEDGRTVTASARQTILPEDERTVGDRLDEPVTSLRGIAAGRAQRLEAIGVRTVRHLLAASPEDVARAVRLTPGEVRPWFDEARELAVG